jgi:SSS family solute:Na+ symporter
VPLRRAGVMTNPEYYERRFGRRTRILGGILLALGGILNMGLFLKVGPQFGGGVTGMYPHSGVLVAVLSSLLLLVLFYTVLGGMVSVVLTDYVQFVVLSLGLLLVVVLAMAHFGMDEIFAVIRDRKGEGGFDPTISESGFGYGYVSWPDLTDEAGDGPPDLFAAGPQSGSLDPRAAG